MTQDERNALLKLADHVDVLVRFCSVYMPSDRVDQYYAGANAFWSIVHRIAGDDAKADEMATKVPDEVITKPLWPERVSAEATKD